MKHKRNYFLYPIFVLGGMKRNQGKEAEARSLNERRRLNQVYETLGTSTLFLGPDLSCTDSALPGGFHQMRDCHSRHSNL